MQAPHQPESPAEGPPRLTVRVIGSSSRARVLLSGELDMATAPQLTELVGDLSHDGHCDLRVDLDGVTFVDASGLAALVASRSICQHRQTNFTVTGGSPLTRQLLTITGLDQLLTLE